MSAPPARALAAGVIAGLLAVALPAGAASASDANAPRKPQSSAAKKHPRPDSPAAAPATPAARAAAAAPPVAAPAPAPEPVASSSPGAPEDRVPVLGRKVFSAAGEELGRVVNVLVDRNGRTRAAVIDFGGFLGVGSRKVSVDWGDIAFRPGEPERAIVVNLAREQIQKAPEYKDGPVGAPSGGTKAGAEGDAGKRGD